MAPRPGNVTDGPTMVVTQLNLRFRFQNKKLRGVGCELIRYPHGVLPETFLTMTGQVVVPILLSTLGMMTAGLVMNTVQVRAGRLGQGEQEPASPGSTAGAGWDLTGSSQAWPGCTRVLGVGGASRRVLLPRFLGP